MLWGWFLAVTTLLVAKCLTYHLTEVKMKGEVKVSGRPSPSGSSFENRRFSSSLFFDFRPTPHTRPALSVEGESEKHLTAGEVLLVKWCSMGVYWFKFATTTPNSVVFLPRHKPICVEFSTHFEFD